MRVTVSLVLVSILSIVVAVRSVDAQNRCQLTITSPANGARVASFAPTGGNISADTAATGSNSVWVVIHPDGDYYWVQNVGRVDGTGNWRANTQYGGPGANAEQQFEVQAFVAPTQQLRVGDSLTNFPTAACSSNLVRVRL